jgi:hypothetical protein
MAAGRRRREKALGEIESDLIVQAGVTRAVPPIV